jgi:hypothetical protein
MAAGHEFGRSVVRVDRPDEALAEADDETRSRASIVFGTIRGGNW